jgi:hypothetical protein
MDEAERDVILPIELGQAVPRGLRILEFVTHDGNTVPFVASAMGRAWKLIKDPNLPECSSQYRQKIFCNENSLELFFSLNLAGSIELMGFVPLC